MNRIYQSDVEGTLGEPVLLSEEQEKDLNLCIQYAQVLSENKKYVYVFSGGSDKGLSDLKYGIKCGKQIRNLSKEEKSSLLDSLRPLLVQLYDISGDTKGIMTEEEGVLFLCTDTYKVRWVSSSKDNVTIRKKIEGTRKFESVDWRKSEKDKELVHLFIEFIYNLSSLDYLVDSIHFTIGAGLPISTRLLSDGIIVYF